MSIYEEMILEGLEGIIDTLAAIEHERWAHWQKYLHSKGIEQPDGSIVLPPALVERWRNEIEQNFSQLDEHQKDSDRAQVRQHLRLISQALAKQINWRD